MKKNLILSLLVLVFGFGLKAQVVKVPDAAKKHFASKYPKADKVEWSNNVAYETVTFVSGGKSYKAFYDLDGKWTHAESEITDADLPAAVKDGLAKSKYANWPVKDVAWLEVSKGVQYRVHVKKDITNDRYLVFDKAGKLVNDNVTLD